MTIADYPLAGDDSDYRARFTVTWGTLPAGGANEVGLKDSPEFRFYNGNYKQYKVNGVKIQWIPDKPFSSNGTLYEFRDLHMASFTDLDTYTTNTMLIS